MAVHAEIPQGVDWSVATRINGVRGGGWPVVKDGLFTGEYDFLVSLHGNTLAVSKAEWKQAKPSVEAS